jgi:hypothetical protein
VIGWIKYFVRPIFYKVRLSGKFLFTNTYQDSTIIKMLNDSRFQDIAHIINNYKFVGDELLTTHCVDFAQELKFKYSIENCYEGVVESLACSARKDLLWRYHICSWAAKRCCSIDGDFVELGVWYGLLSHVMCNYIDIDKTNKTFWLVDSWGKIEGSHPNPAYEKDIYHIVNERFRKWKNVKLIRGLVPEALNEISSSKIAYLGIDMNSSKPERLALEFFYDKIQPGGVIFFDDYGWGYPELRYEVDDFLKDKPEKLLHFPSGNSILIKE